MSDPKPPRWLKPVNKLMIGLQKLGIPTGPPAEAARPVLRAFPVQVPVGARFLKQAGLVDKGTPDEVEALAGRIAVFRFDPAS